MNNEGHAPEDAANIEAILSDLDDILSGKTPVAGWELPPVAPAQKSVQPKETLPAPKPVSAPKPTPDPTPVSKPVPAPAPVPRQGSAPAPVPKPVAPPLPASAPAQTPAAKPAPTVASSPGPSPQQREIKPSDALKIELPPRSGIMPAPAAKPKPDAVPKPKPTPFSATASAYRPPLEIDPGKVNPPPKTATDVPKAAVAIPAAAQQVAPQSKTVEVPAKTSGPAKVTEQSPKPSSAAVPPPIPVPIIQEDPIPPEVPKGQIRKMAFVFAGEQAGKYNEFSGFLRSMALHFTKKPLYIQKTLVCVLASDETPQALCDRIKASGAVGVVGLLGAPSEAKLRGLEEPLSGMGLFFRWIPVEDVLKRSTSVDLLVDMALLSAE